MVMSILLSSSVWSLLALSNPCQLYGLCRTPSLQLGDAVMGTHYGSFAEYVCIKPDEAMKIPPNLSRAAAATLAGGAVGYAAVTKVAKVEPGQTVLVTGANGGLGIVACQVARACGAKVIALVSSSDRAERLRNQLSLDHIVTTDKPTWVEQVKELSDGRGIDVMIDNVGFVEEGLRCLKLGGCIVIVGFAGRGGVMEKVAMNKILLKGARVIGFRFGEQSRQDPSYLEEVWQGYGELLGSGRVKALLDPRIYRGIKDVPRALQDLAERKLLGKAVVSIEGRESSRL